MSRLNLECENPMVSKSSLRAVFSRVFGIPDKDLPEIIDTETIATWDSLAHLSLVEEIERVFEVTLAQSEAVTMLSEADIVRVLEKKLQK